MGVEHEVTFETEICEYLGAHGWTYEAGDAEPKYDAKRALIPEDVWNWLETTQPDEWAKVVKPTDSPAQQAQAKEQLLDRLVATLDAPLTAGGGTLNVLRRGFKKTPASFSMCEFKPVTTLNAETLRRYEAVNLRVMRQVYYSVASRNNPSIDLVLFVNGLPVATIELKTDNTQSITDAIAQYKNDRSPKGEPLLGFANRALVHFAVSNDEAWMTTKLAGPNTHFLPFNRGNNGGAGNPVEPGKSATAYLWEQVLQRDSWLNILGKLLHLEHREATDPITGEVSKSTALLFPRFHQWDLVGKLLDTVAAEGPGQRYLVQHSAGSGKTNSISWLAHGLARLHNAGNKKVFDTVIVVTDRTVLDDQLQAAIKQIEGVDGTVGVINIDEAAKAGAKSKSALLAEQLGSGKLIVVVTLQTFPFALEEIRKSESLAGRRFAIIADEAHSSQTGAAANKLKLALTEAERAELEDGGELDAEQVLAAEMAGRADSANLSFFAFTATPKTKTLELFGRPGADGKPAPFHVYTMQQAIEEGYILDVLRNYTSYDTAYQLAHADRRPLRPVGDEVDESEATKKLMRWVSLHPTNIAQKVQIIVEHYRSNVAGLLGGHAKAMVVTASREAAVKYKHAIDEYITKNDYPLHTLVAFSGTLDRVADVAFAGVEPPYSEANLNSGLRGRSLPKAFASDDFQLLIVANKYQTGFDQPLLCAMYVDKRLDGVNAVQTLSRLNRTYPVGGKDTTYVLDFVNDPSDILDAFLPYYGTAQIEQGTDPDVVHDLQAKLDSSGIYTRDEVNETVAAYLRGEQGGMNAPLKAAADRFNHRYADAVEHGSKATRDELDLFRKDAGSFVRLYEFLSQIVNYGDTDVEKLSIFLRFLSRRLTGLPAADPIDFSAVELVAIKQKHLGEVSLDLKRGELKLLPPLKPGGGAVRDPHLARLEEIIARINALFEGEDFRPGAIDVWVQSVGGIALEMPEIQAQGAVNTKAQFIESPNLNEVFSGAALDTQLTTDRISQLYFSNAHTTSAINKLIAEWVYEQLQRQQA